MQIWLEPINFIGTPSQSPLCSVLVRLWHSLNNTDCDEAILDQINNLAAMAARGFPGNLQEYAGNIDVDQYAYEVIRTERERLDLPRSLSRVLQSINESHNEEVEWCLPIIDPELFLADSVKFVNELRGQKWLSIYVISDIDLKRFFGYTRNVTFLTETEFVAMNVMSEAMDMLRSKSVELSLPNPLQPSSDKWNLGINHVLK